MKHDAHYWIGTLQRDSVRLSEDKKYRVIKSLLMHEVPLSSDDADFFISANPKPDDFGGTVRFSGIERKVALSYSSSQRTINEQPRRNKFFEEFKDALKGFYKEEELEELATYMVDGGEGLAVKWLVGLNHPAVRRIRNAYLPEITSLVRIDIDNQGNVIAVEDETPKLFNGREDAVAQIEKILGIE